MALTNYGGTAYYSATVTLYSNTGYTVDHLPGDYSLIPSARVAVVNAEARLLTVYGIGVLRVAMPAIGVDVIDYCKVSPKVKINRQPAGADISTGAGFSPAVASSYDTQWKDGYYFVTGHGEPNGGVVVLTVMLDCYTTLAANGYKFSSFGGILTRVPVNTIGTGLTANRPVTEFNTFVEPFTTGFRLRHYVRYIKPTDFEGITSRSNVHMVLSPYRLYDSTDITTETTTTGSGTTSDTSTTNRSTSIRGYYKARAANVSSFRVGTDKNVSTANYGVAAYDATDAIKANVSQLYAAGISNAVYDAYTALAETPGASQDSPYFVTVSGVDSSLTFKLADADGFDAFDRTRKKTYYGRYLTLICLSSGESQTVDLVDAVDGLGNITIDIASDPSPAGCIYMRIRKQTEDIPEDAINAMLPGHVCGTTWRRIGIAATLNGRGVELGQTWRSASLDLDARTAELNADATAAQYDMSVGNGYILKNAGNQYGLSQLRESQRYAAENYRNQANQNNVKAVVNAIQTASSALSTSQTGGTAAGLTAMAGITSSGLDWGYSQQNMATALQNTANSGEISAAQLTESGQYNTQLLSAQANAATQIAQASIDKVELQRTQLRDFPTIPILSSESRGILNGTADRFVLVETCMAEEDMDRFDQMLVNFGQATYISPDKVSTQTGGPLTPNNGWNYYKLDAPGNKWKQNDDFPGWIVKGAYDQLSAGVWFQRMTSGGVN